MPTIARSARGTIVDFDIMKIKQQLAANPVQVGTEERRRFIDTKDGIKPKPIVETIPEIPAGLKDISALSIASQFVVEEESFADDESPAEELPVDLAAELSAKAKKSR